MSADSYGVTPDERRRVSLAVEERMRELGMTNAELARRAGVDPTTVRAFLRARRWPHASTRRKLADALGWNVGDAMTVAMQGHVSLETIPTRELILELCRRLEHLPADVL